MTSSPLRLSAPANSSRTASVISTPSTRCDPERRWASSTGFSPIPVWAIAIRLGPVPLDHRAEGVVLLGEAGVLELLHLSRPRDDANELEHPRHPQVAPPRDVVPDDGPAAGIARRLAGLAVLVA